MSAYVIMEPPGGISADAAADARLLRDGFSWLAFLVSPLWLLWHRLWLEALLVFLVMSVLNAAGQAAGHGVIGMVMSVLVSLFIGLEGQRMRLAALGRRGWRERGVIEADGETDAETRYALEAAERPEQEAPLPEIIPDTTQIRAGRTDLMLGVSNRSGRY